MRREKEQEVIEITQDVRVGDFLLETGDKIVILDEKEDGKDDEKSSNLDSIMKKVSDGKELTDAEKKTLASAVDASKKAKGE